MIPQIFVITGANQGLGYGIVEKLATILENAVIYITAIEESLGKAAVQKLTETYGTHRKVKFYSYELDITNASACQEFARYLETRHGTINVLINNAGVAFHMDAMKSREEKESKAQLTIDVNYYGTKQITACLLPLMATNSRVVNICSQLGNIRNYDQRHIQKLSLADNEQQIDEFVEEYLQCVREDTCLENGFHESSYRVSKAALIALSLLQHRETQKRKINFYACCPGSVNTTLTRNQGNLSVQDGADTPAFCAVDPEAQPGAFLYLRKPIAWY